MKRTSLKAKRNIKLKRRLELVRTTIRELTPAQLEQINGGNTEPQPMPDAPGCIRPYTQVTTM